MTHIGTSKIPEDIESLLIDITDVNNFIMSLDTDERRKFTRELKSRLAILFVAQKSKKQNVDIQKLAEWLKLGFDPDYAKETVLLSTGQRHIMITVPSQIMVGDKYVTVMTRSQLQIIIPPEVISGLKQKYGSVLKVLRGLVAIEFEKRQSQSQSPLQKSRYRLVAVKVRPLVSEIVDENIRRLYQKYVPIELLLYLIGVRPNETTIRIMLPKVLPWFIVENEPVHCAIFEPPETGKSHTAILASTICNYYYTTEPPSRAFFIHDARRQSSESIVIMYNGIIIDEAEKTMSKYPQDWEDFLSACMTGMEQGKWVRSKGYGQTIEKMFTVVLQGNTFETIGSTSIAQYLEGEQEETKEDPRVLLKNMMQTYIKRLNTAGIVTRLTYVTYRTDIEPITPHLIDRFAPTPILRGLWKLIQNDIDTICTRLKPKIKNILEKITGKQFGYESRAFRHVYKVTVLLHVLFRHDVDDTLVDIARKVVKYGDIDSDDISELLSRSKSGEPEEEKVETVMTVEKGEEKSSEDVTSEPPF